MDSPSPTPASSISASPGVLIVVLVGVTMVTGIISSLGAPLLPAVAQSLHISLDQAQWSLTAALVSAAVAAPVMGRLGDGRWRRETLIVGLSIVLVGGIVAGIAHSLAILVIGRAMQGIGLALAPVTMAAARDHLPPAQGRAVIGVLSVSAAAAVGAGYPISGLIASELDVHAAFMFGAAISALALAATIRIIPSSRRSDAVALDIVGALVIAGGLVALLLAISEGQRWGWSSRPTVSLILAAALVLGFWVRTQLSRDGPLVDLRQLRHRSVLMADLAAMVLGVAMYMFLTLVTEFVQEPRAVPYGLGASALTAGLCLVPFSLTSLAASRITPSFTRRTSASTVLAGGSLIIASAGAFFALIHGALWEAFVTMGVIGIGFGGTFAAIPSIITTAVPGRETGSAMGLYQVIRYIGFSLGSALAASILSGSTAHAGGPILEAGYETALWVGAGICAVSAGASWVLSRGIRTEFRDAMPAVAFEQLAREDAELASAGLGGLEADE